MTPTRGCRHRGWDRVHMRVRFASSSSAVLALVLAGCVAQPGSGSPSPDATSSPLPSIVAASPSGSPPSIIVPDLAPDALGAAVRSSLHIGVGDCGASWAGFGPAGMDALLAADRSDEPHWARDGQVWIGPLSGAITGYDPAATAVGRSGSDAWLIVDDSDPQGGAIHLVRWPAADDREVWYVAGGMAKVPCP